MSRTRPPSRRSAGTWLRAGTAALLLAAASLPREATAQLNEVQLAGRRRSEESLLRHFRGSLAAVSTYLGSGTFVADDFSNNPYLSEELLLRPRFWLDRRRNVQLLWLVECELTAPDDPAGRHCWPSDLRASLHDVDLWHDPWIHGRVLGSLQLWLPTSPQARQNHTVLNVRAALAYMVLLARERLQLSYGWSLQKYLPADKVRGRRGRALDDGGIPICLTRASAGQDAACGSGGPLNDNWLLAQSFGVQWFFRPDLWLSLDLSVWHFWRFAVERTGSDPRLPAVGRADLTWGTIEAGYQWREHLVLALGATSRQPALTASGKAPRFPFWDFVSPSNNFSKLYVTATWVY